MKEIFQFIFLTRYMKSEKIKITLSDLFRIWRTYVNYKISRWMKFREFYESVVQYSIEHMVEFKTGRIERVYEIVESENNKLING